MSADDGRDLRIDKRIEDLEDLAAGAPKTWVTPCALARFCPTLAIADGSYWIQGTLVGKGKKERTLEGAQGRTLGQSGEQSAFLAPSQ